jgi:hypothetical protein
MKYEFELSDRLAENLEIILSTQDMSLSDFMEDMLEHWED